MVPPGEETLTEWNLENQVPAVFILPLYRTTDMRCTREFAQQDRESGDVTVQRVVASRRNAYTLGLRNRGDLTKRWWSGQYSG